MNMNKIEKQNNEIKVKLKIDWEHYLFLLATRGPPVFLYFIIAWIKSDKELKYFLKFWWMNDFVCYFVLVWRKFGSFIENHAWKLVDFYEFVVYERLNFDLIWNNFKMLIENILEKKKKYAVKHWLKPILSIKSITI